MLDYSPLWATMEKKGISQYRLLKSGIDNKTLDALKKGNNITLLTLEKLCTILDCTPNDVVRFQNSSE
jgi:DNA-binding Xre family transcriptional regulator